MKKSIIFYFLIIFLLGLFVFLFITKDAFLNLKEEKDLAEENLAFFVNNNPVTEIEIESYIREIIRDNFTENISMEGAREMAIEKIVKIIITNDYFDSQGIFVTEEDFENELLSLIINQPGVETEEEYFDIMAMQGFSREEVERNTIMSLKMNKLIYHLSQDVYIDEENIFQKYEQYKNNSAGGMVLPLDMVEDIIKKELSEEIAEEKIIEEVEKLVREAEIKIVKEKNSY